MTGSFMWKASSSCQCIIRSLPGSSLGFDNVTSLAATLIHFQSSFTPDHRDLLSSSVENITKILHHTLSYLRLTSSWVWVSETGWCAATGAHGSASVGSDGTVTPAARSCRLSLEQSVFMEAGILVILCLSLTSHSSLPFSADFSSITAAVSFSCV